jgi:hypothetical protein
MSGILNPVNLLIIGKPCSTLFGDCCRQLAALAVLWKFEVTTRDIDNNDSLPESATHLLICDDLPEEVDSQVERLVDAGSFSAIMLVTTVDKKYGPHLTDRFGISGVRAFIPDTESILTVNDDHPLSQGLARSLVLKNVPDSFYGELALEAATPLITTESGACILAGKGNCCSVSLSLWQTGVPSLPELLIVLRNFLFFSGDRGYFSPYPFASLRIDDFPLTSEQYIKSGGVSDEDRLEEVRALCTWSERYGARLEFMVNSHVMEKDGSLRPVDKVVPQSASLLRDYYRKGVINISAHGRSHLDEEQFCSNGNVSPLEFSGLSAEETKQHLEDNIKYIMHFFGKKAVGFVAPCWGYRENLTKQICANFLSFVVDSPMHYQANQDCQPTGMVDQRGLMHLVETWHLGSRFFDHSAPALWQTFIACGIPIHMMAHGPYLKEPIPNSRMKKFGVYFVFVLALPLLTLWCPGDMFRMVRSFASPIKWGRLDALRRSLVKIPGFCRASVQDLICTGKKMNARWAFTEELAAYLREYGRLEIKEYLKDEDVHQIRFAIGTNVKGPILFHLPQPAVTGLLDDHPIPIATGGRLLELADLSQGEHCMKIRMQ